MPSALDVARFILRKTGSISALKLETLVYYCQAWSLVWDKQPLFDGEIQAWPHGPVVPELYALHQGLFTVHSRDLPKGTRLNPKARETVNAVLKFYADKPGHYLSDLVHREDPWRDARQGLVLCDRGSRVISHAAMAKYYASLTNCPETKTEKSLVEQSEKDA